MAKIYICDCCKIRCDEYGLIELVDELKGKRLNHVCHKCREAIYNHGLKLQIEANKTVLDGKRLFIKEFALSHGVVL